MPWRLCMETEDQDSSAAESDVVLWYGMVCGDGFAMYHLLHLGCDFSCASGMGHGVRRQLRSRSPISPTIWTGLHQTFASPIP
jgi:hypothetical protein